jgi:hypothetical protein
MERRPKIMETKIRFERCPNTYGFMEQRSVKRPSCFFFPQTLSRPLNPTLKSLRVKGLESPRELLFCAYSIF